MIILPVEKRLQWNRAPFILFTIVLINIAIYFFYQMNDDSKYDEAYKLYYMQDLDTVEVPMYMDYIELPKNSEQREIIDDIYEYEYSFDDELILEEQQFLDDKITDSDDIKQDIRELRYKEIATPLILRDGNFYDYVQSRPELFDSKEAYSAWQDRRIKVNEVIETASSEKYALVPAERDVFTFISHQFMHGDIMHLAGNMFFLLVCGFAVEAAIGHLRFLLFYLTSGVIGGLAHMFSDPNSIIPLVGASGAISGVMAMYMGIFRLQKIEFFYWFYVVVGYFRAPALLILAIYISKEAVSYFYLDDGVAYMAHMGGFLAGFLLILAVLVFKRDFLDDEYIEADNELEPEQIQQAKIKTALEKLHFKTALQLVSEQLATGTSADEYHSDNVLLNAKLLNLVDAEDADNSIITLLANNKPKLYELNDYLALWNKVKNKAKTSAEARLKLGLSFLALDDVSVSENIFNTLMEQKCTDSKMSVLAGRLAYHYDQKQQADKAEHYLKLSESFASYR